MTAQRKWRFSARLTMAALVLIAIGFKLSAWQFDRAAAKRGLEEAAAAAITAAAVTRRVAGGAAAFERAAVVGEYLPAAEILLDNRVHQRLAGYHVVTPFAFVDGGVVMIKRGWLLNDGRRDVLPSPPTAPAGKLTVVGVFWPDEADAFVLSNEPETGVVRQWLNLPDIAAEMELDLMSVVLIKEPQLTDTMPAVSLRTDFKAARSTVYAWQWLTLVLLVVTLGHCWHQEYSDAEGVVTSDTVTSVLSLHGQALWTACRGAGEPWLADMRLLSAHRCRHFRCTELHTPSLQVREVSLALYGVPGFVAASLVQMKNDGPLLMFYKAK